MRMNNIYCALSAYLIGQLCEEMNLLFVCLPELENGEKIVLGLFN